MNVIKDFNFAKEWKDIQDWIAPRGEEIYEEHKKKINKYRMNELSMSSSYDYDQISINTNVRDFMGQAQIEDVLFGEWMTKIGDFCVKSISYVYSIIAEPPKKTHGGMVKNFLFKFSDKSEKAKDFIAFWVKLRNEWEHNHKFFDEVVFKEKYFPKTHLIDAKVVGDYMQEIFIKVNEKYPPTKFKVDIDKLPRI